MDAHNAEYLAAVEGMTEIYGARSAGSSSHDANGKLITTWGVGDFVTARLPTGEERLVTIIEVLVDAGEDSEYHVACHIPGQGRQHFAIKNRDVLIF